jgi:hypothetical protein
MLNEEHIHFDSIITDNKELAKQWNIVLINTHLELFFSKIDTNWNHLIILDKLGVNDILQYIKDFKSVSILSANSALGSFSKKYHHEIGYLWNKGIESFNFCFPRDLESFLKLLKDKTNVIFPLSSQEIADNIYASPSEEEEWIQYIDKNLIDNSEILSLLSPEKADLLVVWFWNHFEELVKLSQLLSLDKARIALAILNNWNYLFSEEFKEYYKNAKRIAFILDCNVNKEIETQLSKLWKPVEFITPEFEKLTSIFPEYYYEQTWFNANSLYEKCISLV